MFEKTKGLILRRTKFGEAHAYVTALTADGLVTFTAYGIMSPKSKSFASCQPYTLSELVLTKKGERLTLSEASTIMHIVRQGVDFERLTLANYISSMASETSFTPEDAPAIYSLTCTALSLTASGDIPTKIIKAVFEMRLTACLGFYPDLEECSICSKKPAGGIFVPRDGNIICHSCAVSDEIRGVGVTEGLISALRHMLALDDRRAFGIKFSDPVLENAFCTLAEQFSTEHLDCAIGALKFYKQNLRNF